MKVKVNVDSFKTLDRIPEGLSDSYKINSLEQLVDIIRLFIPPFNQPIISWNEETKQLELIDWMEMC